MEPTVKNIFLSKDHVVSPFTTTPELGLIKLSTLEKTASIGLSVLLGLFTLLIGGVVAFYWITARIKSSNIKKLNPGILNANTVEEKHTPNKFPFNSPENKNTLLRHALSESARIPHSPFPENMHEVSEVSKDLPPPSKSKKRVRFADEIHLPLAVVKIFDRDLPIGPSSTFSAQIQKCEAKPSDEDPSLSKDLTALSREEGQKTLMQRVKPLQPVSRVGYPLSTDQRRYPPLGTVDTVKFEHGKPVSAHPEKIDLFKKDEIITLHAATSEQINDLLVHKDEKNRIVIQQQATRGCTAAAVSMLIYPKCGRIDVPYLRRTNLGDTTSMQSKIAELHLASRVTKLDLKKSIEDLLFLMRNQLIVNGSAIIEIGGEIGGHVVLVDEISEDLQTIRLRDPYHGWAISVGKNAFSTRLKQGQFADMLQIIQA